MSFPKIDGVLRASLVTGFPFQILYRLRKPDLIEVVAVAHAKRDPGYWSERIQDE